MARRKNVKRIDPRYFMDEKMEHTQVIMEAAQSKRLMPYLTAMDYPAGEEHRPLEALTGFNIGDLDLADFVRDWHHELARPGFDAPAGTPTSEVAAAHMKQNPDRAKAYEYLKSIVQMYDEYSVASQEAAAAGEDVGAVNDMVMKKYGKQLTGAQKQLPKLFGKRGGTTGSGSGAQARSARAAQAAKQSRSHDKGDQERLRKANKASRESPRQTF